MFVVCGTQPETNALFLINIFSTGDWAGELKLQAQGLAVRVPRPKRFKNFGMMRLYETTASGWGTVSCV